MPIHAVDSKLVGKARSRSRRDGQFKLTLLLDHSWTDTAGPLAGPGWCAADDMADADIDLRLSRHDRTFTFKLRRDKRYTNWNDLTANDLSMFLESVESDHATGPPSQDKGQAGGDQQISGSSTSNGNHKPEDVGSITAGSRKGKTRAIQAATECLDGPGGLDVDMFDKRDEDESMDAKYVGPEARIRSVNGLLRPGIILTLTEAEVEARYWAAVREGRKGTASHAGPRDRTPPSSEEYREAPTTEERPVWAALSPEPDIGLDTGELKDVHKKRNPPDLGPRAMSARSQSESRETRRTLDSLEPSSSAQREVSSFDAPYEAKPGDPAQRPAPSATAEMPQRRPATLSTRSDEAGVDKASPDTRTAAAVSDERHKSVTVERQTTVGASSQAAKVGDGMTRDVKAGILTNVPDPKHPSPPRSSTAQPRRVNNSGVIDLTADTDSDEDDDPEPPLPPLDDLFRSPSPPPQPRPGPSRGRTDRDSAKHKRPSIRASSSGRPSSAVGTNMRSTDQLARGRALPRADSIRPTPKDASSLHMDVDVNDDDDDVVSIPGSPIYIHRQGSGSDHEPEPARSLAAMDSLADQLMLVTFEGEPDQAESDANHADMDALPALDALLADPEGQPTIIDDHPLEGVKTQTRALPMSKEGYIVLTPLPPPGTGAIASGGKTITAAHIASDSRTAEASFTTSTADDDGQNCLIGPTPKEVSSTQTRPPSCSTFSFSCPISHSTASEAARLPTPESPDDTPRDRGKGKEGAAGERLDTQGNTSAPPQATTTSIRAGSVVSLPPAAVSVTDAELLTPPPTAQGGRPSASASASTALTSQIAASVVDSSSGNKPTNEGRSDTSPQASTVSQPADPDTDAVLADLAAKQHSMPPPEVAGNINLTRIDANRQSGVTPSASPSASRDSPVQPSVYPISISPTPSHSPPVASGPRPDPHSAPASTTTAASRSTGSSPFALTPRPRPLPACDRPDPTEKAIPSLETAARPFRLSPDPREVLAPNDIATQSPLKHPSAKPRNVQTGRPVVARSAAGKPSKATASRAPSTPRAKTTGEPVPGVMDVSVVHRPAAPSTSSAERPGSSASVTEPNNSPADSAAVELMLGSPTSPQPGRSTMNASATE